MKKKKEETEKEKKIIKIESRGIKYENTKRNGVPLNNPWKVNKGKTCEH